MKKLFTILVGISLNIFYGCTSSIPIPTNTIAQGERLNDLKQGRELFVYKCSGCHSLYPPSSYSQKEWNEILPEMNTKAQTTTRESFLIKQYIFTFSQ
mgnify:CR=1 FL=1